MKDVLSTSFINCLFSRTLLQLIITGVRAVTTENRLTVRVVLNQHVGPIGR
jgi:hypothetical protein